MSWTISRTCYTKKLSATFVAEVRPAVGGGFSWDVGTMAQSHAAGKADTVFAAKLASTAAWKTITEAA